MSDNARPKSSRRTLVSAIGVAVVTIVVIAAALLLRSGPPGPVALDGPAPNDEVLDLSDSGSQVTVELTVDADGFHPAFVKVAPRAEVAVVIHNRGDEEHTFVIENDVASFDEHIDPGETASTPFAFEMPDDRAVRFLDHEHYWDGPFQGAFYTRAGQPLAEGDDLPERDE